MNSRQHFINLLTQDPVDLAHVALLAVQILAEDSPAAIAATVRGRAQMTELVAAASAAGCATSVPGLVEFLATERGFGGNSLEYYATANSDLAQVLANKSGIPITLALVYLEVGRGLGLDLRGIGFPGHFLVGDFERANPCEPQQLRETALIDPFAGGFTTRAECLHKLESMQRASGQASGSIAGLPAAQTEQWFQPATPAQITLRLLENLKQIHLRMGAHGASLAALELQLLVAPDQVDLRTQHEALIAHLFGGGTNAGTPEIH